jgi:hypothetical protein
MNVNILKHFQEYSTYTYPGCYAELLRSLPDDITEMGMLVTYQVIHRVILQNGNTGRHADTRYGNMNEYPWYRLRCDDDVLVTSAAMLAELMRLDSRGFIKDRTIEKKIVVTCRYVAILIASILKTKGIPCRVRSGFGPYLVGGESWDHWINQYWDNNLGKWVTIDADGFYKTLPFNQYDIPDTQFDWAGQTWLGIRNGSLDGKRYVYADNQGTRGLKAAIRAIFYDLHSLMNNEITFNFQPQFIDGKYNQLSENNLIEIDQLAELLCDPDNNFDKIKRVWEGKRKYRILNTPLITDEDHVFTK